MTDELQSRVLPGPERIHVSALIEGDKLVDATADPSVKTLYDCLLRGAKESENGDCLGDRNEGYGNRRRYGWIKYNEVINRAQRVGSAIKHLGYPTGGKTLVGIIGSNCLEYVVTEFGCWAYSMVVVPLYHNYHEDALVHIINSCKLEIVFCDTDKRVEQLLKLAKQATSVKHIVQMRGNFAGKKREELGILAKENNIELLDYDYFFKLGDSNLIPVQPPKPEDVYLICHTSGTTGPPKGVVLTHKAMVANVGACDFFWTKVGQPLTKEDVTLSFLPLAHIFQQLMDTFIIYVGGRIGFYSGDVLKLFDDMQELKPTAQPVVPRVLNKLKARIESGIEEAGGIKKYLFDKAMDSKMKLLEQGVISKATLWDKLVLSKMRNILGGQMRVMYTGGAPISPEVLRFFRAAFGCTIVEGYGQTECAACGTLTLPSDTIGGNVGGPAPWAQVKLEDVTDMEYLAKDDKGEVLIRGPAVMREYYQNPDATSSTIDSDGWLHTGDIGMWQPNGGLKIIDRKKEFFKLAQGDYVSPEVVENAYSFSPLLNQIYVAGWSIKSCLVGIAVPNIDKLRFSIEKEAIPGEEINTDEKMLAHDKVRQHMLTELRIVGAEKGLSSIQQIKALHLTPDEFTNENGLLTPTMKLRRIALKKIFASNIENLYAELD